MAEYYSVLSDREAKKSLLNERDSLTKLAEKYFDFGNIKVDSQEFYDLPTNIQCLFLAFTWFCEEKSLDEELEGISFDNDDKEYKKDYIYKIDKYYRKIKKEGIRCP